MSERRVKLTLCVPQAKDVAEAFADIHYLSGRVRTLDKSRAELRNQESKTLAELEHLKWPYRYVLHENGRLKGTDGRHTNEQMAETPWDI